MLQIKIHGSTPKSGKSLCLSCKSARIARGQNCEEQVVCHAGMFPNNWTDSGQVAFRVAECTEYKHANMPELHEMEKIAWSVEARKRGTVGFEPEKSEMEIIVTPPKKEGQETPE